MLASRIFANNTTRQTQVSKRKYSTLPLSEPLPNVPKQNEIPLSAPTITSSKLNNGVRITTVASKTSPISSIGVFLESGSRYEDPSNSGSTLFLKQLAFQKTSTRSSLKLVRDIEEIGATYTVSAGREYLSYVSEVSTEKLGQVIPILADVLNPQIEDYQLKETQELVKGVVESALSNPGIHVLEQLHADAFRNKGLGLPFYSLHNLEHLDVEKLNKFASQNNSADRVVIVAVGDINHQELTEIISKSFSGLGTKSARNKSPSEYFGGESRTWAHSSVAHVAVGFQGTSWSDKDLPALSVLQFLLGSGRASTLEGPGIGFASRLNRNIVETSNGDIHQLSAFHLPYSDTGLFGFYGVSTPGKTNSMIEKLTKEISALNSATIDSKELARAKAQSKADVLFNSQTTSSLVDYIGIHAVSKDKAGLPIDFAKAVDQVSAEDVKNVAKKVFKSKPSVSSIGDIESVPSREHIQSAFA